MKLMRIIGVVCLMLSAVPMRAQLSEEKPKKQAKDLFDKASREINDHVNQVKDACQAAQLQPREKKYSDACNTYRDAVIHDDQAALASAIMAEQNHDPEKAEALANKVSSLDPQLFSRAKGVLDAVKAQRLSDTAVAEVKAAWLRGDFNTVNQLAPTMPTAAAKFNADLYVKDVKLYNSFIEDANKFQKDNPKLAIDALNAALNLNAHGNVDVKARIAEIIAKGTPPKPPPPPPPPPKTGGTQGTQPGEDTIAKVNKLLADARVAEEQGNPTGAHDKYAEVLKLQPGNPVAQGALTRLDGPHPPDSTNELKSAIRAFYQGQFDDARTALMDYLESPRTAQNPGAADFYLGATLIERSLLRTPQAQWKGPSQDAISAFKQARKANYNPVRAYVSPVLLKVWDTTGP
jgi:hypothetical protein